MRKYLYLFTIVTFLSQFGNAAVEGVRVVNTSNDWYQLNLASDGSSTWLGTDDSVYPGNATYVTGKSGAYFGLTVSRFLLAIPQGATIDSAELWRVSGTATCGSAGNCNTAQVRLRCLVQDADNASQVTSRTGFTAAWAARSTASGATDTALLTDTWSSAGTKYRLPFNQLDSVVQVPISRVGWSSGNAIVLLIVPTANCVDSARLSRNYDFSDPDGTYYDSLWVSYTASAGGGGGATPNTILRDVITRSTIVRAPEKMFYRKENWKW